MSSHKSAAKTASITPAALIDREVHDLDRAVQGIGEEDHQLYQAIISTDLSPEQTERIVTPSQVYPRQKAVLAIHWHPEWIPFELIARRISAMFPGCREELIIPTQHNQILAWGDYAGVEMDCYSSGFNRKVQLLLHFNAKKVETAPVLRAMLQHTFKYRSGQLYEFMDSVVEPEHDERMQEAALETGAGEDLVAFTRFYTARLKKLLELNEQSTPRFMIKNKLLIEYVSAQRTRYPEGVIKRSLLLLKAVKAIVKRGFSLEYFFRASEVIEEVRGLGGGVLIPHPEQFWPILLADYDVDGYEVWNPQSREYTEFLIRALTNQNKRLADHRRPLLVFMGDDTHLSVKAGEPDRQEPAKLEREVGLQPAWDELAVSKSLSLAGASRSAFMAEYRARLG
jgi:hypothetical protein